MSLPPPTYEKTIQIQVTIPDGTSANSLIPAKLIDNPVEGTKDSLQVPVTQVWIIKDIYVKSAPDIDVMLEVYKNGTKKMVRTAPLSTQVITNDSRDKITPLGFEPGSILSVNAINLDANSSGSAVTVTAYVKVAVYGQ